MSDQGDRVWDFEIGASLVLGAWDLELNYLCVLCVLLRQILPSSFSLLHSIGAAVFERQFSNSGFIELAQTLGDHPVILFLGRRSQG